MRSQRGSSLVELLVSMGLLVAIFGGVVSTYSHTARRAYDEGLIGRTNEQARLALDLLSYDLRMAGAGMPLGQGGFVPGAVGLGDAPLPILTDATETSIRFRLNESGRVSVLTSSYTPSPTNLSVSVHSVEGLAVGDTIYLSNATAGGSMGLRGTISQIAGTTVQINSAYVAPSGAVFDSGSVLHKITELSYVSPATNTGLVRNNNASNIMVVPNSSFTLSYFDAAGNAIPLPLTTAVIQNQLCSIGLSVRVVSSSRLRNGSTYTAVAQDRVALRNLILSR